MAPPTGTPRSTQARGCPSARPSTSRWGGRRRPRLPWCRRAASGAGEGGRRHPPPARRPLMSHSTLTISRSLAAALAIGALAAPAASARPDVAPVAPPYQDLRAPDQLDGTG